MRTEPYNSESLQKKFPEVYRELFASSEMVVSCPATFQWAGNCAKRFGSLSLTQSIPLRVYVGCEAQSKRSSVSFGKRWQWNPESGEFKAIDTKPDGIFQQSFFEYLTSFPWCQKQGWKLHFIDEVPGFHGLAKTASRAVALAALSGILGEEWTVNELQEAIKSPPTARHQSGGIVDRLMRRGTKLYSLTAGYPAVPSSIMTTFLTQTSLPIISWSTYRPDILQDRFNETNNIEDLAYIDTAEWHAYSLDEFFGPMQKTIHWPIDLMLISTGHDSAGGAQMFLKQKQDFLNSLLTEKYPKRMSDTTPLASLVKSTLPFGADDLWQNYIATMGVVSLKLVKDLYDTLASHTDTAIKFLAKSMNHYQEVLGLVSLITSYHTPKVVRMQEIIREAIWKIVPTMIPGMKLAGTSKGGDLLLITPLFAIREALSGILERLQREVSSAFDLDYASWIDGFEKDGLRIEHAPQAGIQHTLLPQGRSVVTMVAKDDTTHRVFVTKLDPDMADIVMDDVREKLWVGGKPVAVAEIPSQRMAITLMKLLVKSGKWRLANTDLPESSYSEYRNELQSKVIGRLKRLCEKRLKKELMLGIEGSLTKFDIVWSPDEVTLAIREKAT